MTATEELRRLLDERGVEYETDDVSDSWYEKTMWSSENNLWWTYEVSTIEELPYGTLMLLYTGSSNSMTPEQAIAATLGQGTCKPMTYDNGYSMDRIEPGEYYEFWEPACACSECGELIPMRRFCPNCGAKVVGHTTNDVDAEVDE